MYTYICLPSVVVCFFFFFFFSFSFSRARPTDPDPLVWGERSRSLLALAGPYATVVAKVHPTADGRSPTSSCPIRVQ